MSKPYIDLENVKKIVITGPTGAIGMAILRLCIRNGIEVTVIVRPGSKRNERIPKSPLVHVLECDMSEYAGYVQDVTQGAEPQKTAAGRDSEQTKAQTGAESAAGSESDTGEETAGSESDTGEETAAGAETTGSETAAGAETAAGRDHGISNEACAPDVFYHFAWGCTTGEGRNDMKAQLKNIEYTLDALHLAKRMGCRRFVFAGSQAEYGRYEGALNKDVRTNPENGYGMAKLCAAGMCRVEAAKLGIDFIHTRILSVYGPYDGEGSMVMSAVRSFLAGKRQQFTPAEQLWDYMYSADCARAMLLIGDKGKNNAIYCLGSGKARPLKEYIYDIKTAACADVEPGIGDLPYGKNQVMCLCADITDVQQDTGFEPEYTFEEGIKETVAWMKKQLRE